MLTTQKELSQLYWLNKEITRERWRLKELERAARGGTANISGMPHLGGDIRTLEQYAVQISEMRDRIQQNLDKLLVEYDRLNRYIEAVDDSLVRQILFLRYVDGESWVRVANRLGGGNTADSVRMLHNRYLRQN